MKATFRTAVLSFAAAALLAAAPVMAADSILITSGTASAPANSRHAADCTKALEDADFHGFPEVVTSTADRDATLGYCEVLFENPTPAARAAIGKLISAWAAGYGPGSVRAAMVSVFNDEAVKASATTAKSASACQSLSANLSVSNRQEQQYLVRYVAAMLPAGKVNVTETGGSAPAKLTVMRGDAKLAEGTGNLVKALDVINAACQNTSDI